MSLCYSFSCKGIPNKAFMHNHIPHITRLLKQTTMYAQLPEDLSSPTTKKTPRPTACITLCTQCPSRWILKHRQHLRILQANHTISSTVAQNWVRIQKPVTTWIPSGATSRYFHIPLHYEDPTIMMNISLDTANMNIINMSMLDFRIWQHFNSNWTPPHL